VDLNEKVIGNADVIRVIPLDEIVYLLEDYTEHLEELFEVDLKSYGTHGHTIMQTAKEYWEDKTKGE